MGTPPRTMFQGTPRRASPLSIVAAALLVLPALVIAVGLHRFFMQQPGAVGFDDGYTVSLAERIIDGRWLPYVDGCSHRGPLLYWLVAIAQRVCGRFEWIGPRVLMLGATLATLVGIWGTGFAARMPVGGAVGALVFLYLGLATHEVDSAFAVTGESIAGAFGVLALFACTAALMSARRRRVRLALVAASGALVALAGLVKQTAFPIAVPLFLWIAATAPPADAKTPRARFALVLAFVAGLVAPVALVLARYAIARQLGAFWYWFVVYNKDVYMAPYRGDSLVSAIATWAAGSPWTFFVIAETATWGLVRPILGLGWGRGLRETYANAGLEVTASMLVVVVFAAVASPERFWPPYFLLLFPFVGLVVGVRLGAMLRAARGGPWARFAGALVLGALVTTWVGWAAWNRGERLARDRAAGHFGSPLPEPVCAMLDEYSTPADSLFVWGFDGDFYVTCKRHPAARFTYLTLVAGAVPPFWTDVRPERVARNARADLMADLRRSRPAVVLDSPGAMRNVGLNVLPELVAWLKEEYCSVAPVTSKNGRRAAVWVRRDRGHCGSAQP